MDTDIHSGKANQCGQNNRGPAHSGVFTGTGNSTEGTNRGLGMAAGEGITGSSFPCFLQNGKTGIFHPGSGYFAGDLHSLAGNRTKKSDTHQIVACALADTPEHDQTNYKKSGLLTQCCQGKKYFIKKRIADLFQYVEKSHIVSPFDSIWIYYISI